MAQFLICEEDGFNAATHFNFDEDSHKHLVCAEHLECLQEMGVICMPVAYYDRVESYDQYRLLKRSEERMIQDRKRGLKQWEDDLEYQYSKAQDEVKHLSSLHPGFIPTAPVLDSLLQRKQKLSAQLTHLSQSLSPDSFNDPDTQLLQASYAGELPFFLLVWNVNLGKAPAPVMLSYMGNFEKHRDILQEQITEITRNIDELLQNRSFKNLFHCMHLLALATSLLPDQHDCHLNYYQIITHSLFEKYNQVLGFLNEYSQQIAFSALISFFICGDWRPIKALVVLGRIQDNLASEDKQYRAETLLHLYAVLKALDDLKVPEIAKMRLEVSSRIGVCMRLGGQKTQAIPYLLESMRDISEAEDDLEKKNIALVHVYLGRCFKSAKDTTKAMEHYSFAKPILEAVAPNSKELAKLLYYMVPLLPDPGQQIQFCDSAIEMLRGENKKFTELKAKVATRIGKNKNNIDKVVKVATFIETDNYKTYQASLPSSWGALYLVSGLDDEKLSTLMADKEITNSITRDELAEKVKVIKNPDKKTNQRITIVIEGGTKATNDDLLKLKKYLKREFRVWTITSPEIEDEDEAEK